MHGYANHFSGRPVHSDVKVTVIGTGLNDFRDHIFVSCFMPGIKGALDTYASPANHFTLPPVAGDDGDDGDDGKIPARQYSPCSSTSWQLTIDLSSDNNFEPLPSGNDNSGWKI